MREPQVKELLDSFKMSYTAFSRYLDENKLVTDSDRYDSYFPDSEVYKYIVITLKDFLLKPEHQLLEENLALTFRVIDLESDLSAYKEYVTLNRK